MYTPFSCRYSPLEVMVAVSVHCDGRGTDHITVKGLFDYVMRVHCTAFYIK